MPKYIARVIVHAEYDVTVDADNKQDAVHVAEEQWQNDGEQLIEDVTVDSVDLEEE